MNSGIEIRKLQNEGGNIRLLAAQREMYTQAKRPKTLAMAICYGGPLLYTIVQLFVSLPFCSTIVLALLAIGSDILLNGKSSDLVRNSARIQQAFDSRVYGMEFEDSDFNERDIAHFEKEYLVRCKSFDDLENWYTAIPLDADAGEAISSCQRQNALWTSSLASRYLIVICLVSLAIMFVLGGQIQLMGVDPAGLAFLLALGEFPLRQFCEAFRFRKKATKLKEDFDRRKLVSANSIKETQRLIFEYRESSFLVPDWFHKINKRDLDEKTT